MNDESFVLLSYTQFISSDPNTDYISFTDYTNYRAMIST